MTTVLEKPRPRTTRAITTPPSFTEKKPLPRGRITEQEFIQWCDEDTWAEWVDGEIIPMAPIALDHADCFTLLICVMNACAEEQDQGKVLSEPYQIRLGGMQRRRSPDLFFVSRSRLGLLQRLEFDGAPDLIVEIVSPESTSRDWRVKFHEYEAAGVREHWIVDPQSQVLEAYALTRGKYKLIPLKSGKRHSSVLKGFALKPGWLWKRPLPKVSAILKELNK